MKHTHLVSCVSVYFLHILGPLTFPSQSTALSLVFSVRHSSLLVLRDTRQNDAWGHFSPAKSAKGMAVGKIGH